MMRAMNPDADTTPPAPEAPTSAVSAPTPGAPRVLFGGFLMGLANLVPGISGGTMILAVGLYERFIDTIADLTRLKLRRGPIVFAALIGVGAVAAVLGFSGVAVSLVRDQRWVMYSLFIGMTLGGVPLIWSFLRPFRVGVAVGFLGGFGLMLAQWLELFSTRLPDTTPWLALAGLLGATSMVLPGISGAYVLLILGLYETVIGSISTLRTDLTGSLAVLIPVGIGAALGVGGLSNLLKWLLVRFSAPVHGVLLGLLLGSVFNLYPFEDPVHPELADRSMRKAITALVQGEDVDVIAEKYSITFDGQERLRIESVYRGMGPADIKLLGDETSSYPPGLERASIALLLLLAGFAVTWLLGLTGKGKDKVTASRA
jgi:putative membrane protein